jgi:hypothetical protein
MLQGNYPDVSEKFRDRFSKKGNLRVLDDGFLPCCGP